MLGGRQNSTFLICLQIPNGGAPSLRDFRKVGGKGWEATLPAESQSNPVRNGRIFKSQKKKKKENLIL